MKTKTIDFIKDADNVYRTQKYIVKQILMLEKSSFEDSNIISYDTYYKRNNLRDKQYECVFYDRKRINGKRLSSTMYTRKYID